jgi:hypothetical protein
LFYSTCRQIYHEAATTLLSGNAWIVLRNSYYCSSTVGMLEQRLGSRAGMVKKIGIDLDWTCPIQCSTHGTFMMQNTADHHYGADHSILMLTLLRQTSHRTDLDVEFVHSKPQAHYALHSGDDPTVWHFGVNFAILNTVMRMLKRDLLNIRKSSRRRRNFHQSQLF